MKKGHYKFTPYGMHADAVMDEAKPGLKAGNELIDNMIELGKIAQANAQRMASILHPYIDLLVNQDHQDCKEIERTLDSLLEAMMFGKGNNDFMRLVTYYQGVDNEGANYYHGLAVEEELLSKMRYLDELRDLDLPVEEYAIFGSSPLAVRGIRTNRDIDIVVSQELWNRFSRENIGTNKIQIGHIEICKDWKPYFSDNSVIIDNSELIGDFRYVKLPYVLEWKEQSKNKKDKNDVLLIKEYLSLWKH